ncbi:MAG: SEL1-like repeat protein [Dysgonamonadaceae bacterium]|nr:SEL1-like repeat protein [Dysgonamonadaceae bacterium]
MSKENVNISSLNAMGRTMETGNHFKNGASPKSQTNKSTILSKLFLAILCAFALSNAIFAQTLEELETKAKQGNAEAQHTLGVRYFQGDGVKKDYEKAVSWYEKAANQGYASAQLSLAQCYGMGRGVNKDHYQAFYWLKKAAEQGNKIAQNSVGYFYENGQGVTQDYNQAEVWYQKAAEQGYEPAKTALINLKLQSNVDIPQQSGYSELIKQGLDLMKQEKHTDAAAFFTAATKKAPPARYRNEGWFYLGEAFYREGDYQTALSAFIRYESAANANAPRNDIDGYGCTHVPLDGWACMSRERWHFLYDYIAMCYYKLGNKEESLKKFEWANGMDTKGKIVDRNRQSYAKATSLYNRGIMLKEMGRTDEAASDFAEAWKIKLDWKQSWPAEYEENVTQFLTQYYESAGNYGSLLTVLNRVPDSDRTAEQFNKAAFASFKLGNFENADKYYDKALSLQPSIAIDLEARQTSQKNAAEIREKERLRQAEIERQRREAEARRVAGIKQAQIGDKLLYSESWQWSEGLWIFHQSGTYTMMVTCFIERVEGDRYQLRVGDVQSSSSDRYTSPTINGVKVSKGDIIWARPMNDRKWVYGE